MLALLYCHQLEWMDKNGPEFYFHQRYWKETQQRKFKANKQQIIIDLRVTFLSNNINIEVCQFTESNCVITPQKGFSLSRKLVLKKETNKQKNK